MYVSRITAVSAGGASNPVFMHSHKKANRNQTPSQPMNSMPLKASLLALAAIGAATLESCSMDDTVETRSVPVYETATDSLMMARNNTSAQERIDSIFSSLGMFTNNNKSILDVNCLSMVSDSVGKVYAQPERITDNSILFNCARRGAPGNGSEDFYLIAQKINNGGLRLVKVDAYSGKVSKTSIYQNSDGSVSEYITLAGGQKVEESVMRKIGKGTVEKTSVDGSVVRYTNIDNDDSVPAPAIPLTFSVSVADWVNSNIDNDL